MSEISVLIVEDEPLIAEDIASSLDEINYKVAGIAYDSEKAIDFLHSRKPDLALLDINIKGSKDGIEIATFIKEHYNIPYVFLTSYSDRITLERVKPTMPYGYILKPFSTKNLISTLELALYRHSQEQRGRIPNIELINQNIIDNLTTREYDMLSDIFEGFTNKQISEKRFISINTIKSHIKNLFLKLEVSNRTSAIHKVSHF